MTLSSRHRIRNSSPGGLKPSTLPLGHGGSPQYRVSHVDGGETFCVYFKPPRPGTEPWTLAWKAAVLTTKLGPPPLFQFYTTLLKYNFLDCSFDDSDCLVYHWSFLKCILSRGNEQRSWINLHSWHTSELTLICVIKEANWVYLGDLGRYISGDS